jgi:hypothetical protein
MKLQHNGRGNLAARSCVCVRACASVRPSVNVSNLLAVVCYYWNISTLECTVFEKIILRCSVIIFLLCRRVRIVAKSAYRGLIMPVPLSACISTAPSAGIFVKYDFWNVVDMFRENADLVTIEHGYRTLHGNLSSFYCFRRHWTVTKRFRVAKS